MLLKCENLTVEMGASPKYQNVLTIQIRARVCFFCVSSLLIKTTVPYNGACSTQFFAYDPRSRTRCPGRRVYNTVHRTRMSLTTTSTHFGKKQMNINHFHKK